MSNSSVSVRVVARFRQDEASGEDAIHGEPPHHDCDSFFLFAVNHYIYKTLVLC